MTELHPILYTGTWNTHVNTHVMYSKLKSIDKICVTLKGHFEVNGHTGIWDSSIRHIGAICMGLNVTC